jgi:uncharacterized protein (TIGR00730 family)
MTDSRQDIKSICVYCGSSQNVDEAYKRSATDFGRIMAENNIRLVYGGGRSGLMGLVADAVLEHGGEAIGVIPEHLSEREVQHLGLTELHVVDSMHTRKQKMVDESDAFVVLPGGVGTLDEACEVITWRQLGIHDKPICIVNVDGYWSPLMSLVQNIIDAGFMREGDINTFSMVNSVDDVLKQLRETPKEKFDPTTKWI